MCIYICMYIYVELIYTDVCIRNCNNYSRTYHIGYLRIVLRNFVKKKKTHCCSPLLLRQAIKDSTSINKPL